MKTAEIYSIYNECNGVSTDTRNIISQSMFFALKGSNFDANDFALEALEKGAAYAVVDHPDFKKSDNDRLIVVSDVLTCLQELASFHRKHIGLPVIALTGSNGKTTSKELLNVVLSKHYNTIATIGNLNNHIGVPLTLLRLNEETDLGIIEMGANHQKEIEHLCEIIQPDFGFITNFGRAHLEGFGGTEGVIKGKSEMYAFLESQNKTAFINFDDRIQEEKSKKINRFGFSMKQHQEAKVQITKAYAQPMATLEVNNITIVSNLTGLYNLPNLAFAVSIGLFFNIPITTIKEAIEEYIPQNNRSQWLEKNNRKILMDAYNANPSSMNVAIENFHQLEGANKWMILGDMFELGNESAQEHQQIIREVIETKIPAVFIGNQFFEQQIVHQSLLYFKNVSDFVEYLEKEQPKHSLLLIKGSRAMALEQILDYIH
ncbi:MAG TPA: UDP-N-acetylmuramoyl-tripeptide--D-alanyl-D-alanine ligase [Flavobacterium sp.]|nr:UDP-N-acetylmuramoyl-tripeptide--D-alanyl-D-alanine ligase [Flavobacterium sp.]